MEPELTQHQAGGSSSSEQPQQQQPHNHKKPPASALKKTSNTKPTNRGAGAGFMSSSAGGGATGGTKILHTDTVVGAFVCVVFVWRGCANERGPLSLSRCACAASFFSCLRHRSILTFLWDEHWLVDALKKMMIYCTAGGDGKTTATATI